MADMVINLVSGGVAGSTTVSDVTIEGTTYKKVQLATAKTGAIKLLLDYKKGIETGLNVRPIPHSESLAALSNMPLVSEISSPVSLDTRLYFSLRADTAWPSGLSNRTLAHAKYVGFIIKCNPDDDYIELLLEIVGTTWASATGVLNIAAVAYSR